ncbi:hypothetical protein ACTJJ0_15625 [Chitinophaga sp. 22321]|uniref:Uncharacterized protein n=1 Tax=Chitinophaga hostae TaxID=2831022 RepID=A0ABS5J2P1_9BACT|nr:hypothetical protein [Chitinophaga hostae]MBS0029494.1 hypothetical protein [Chitinophaga hostae]
MRNEYGRRKGWHVAKFLVLGVVFITAIGFATMTLWNCLIPELFHGPIITFWQAIGLLLLGKLLFGWHNHHKSWDDKWARGREWKAKLREKMAHMTPEEQARMREQLRNRCRPGFGRDRREAWERYWDNPSAKDTDQDDPKNEEKESH